MPDCPLNHFRQVHSMALRRLLDLLPAAEPVRDDKGLTGGVSDGRQ
jgi:hypothetical protein